MRVRASLFKYLSMEMRVNSIRGMAMCQIVDARQPDSEHLVLQCIGNRSGGGMLLYTLMSPTLVFPIT